MPIDSVTPKKRPSKVRSAASPPTRKPSLSETSPATHPALPDPALLSLRTSSRRILTFSSSRATRLTTTLNTPLAGLSLACSSVILCATVPLLRSLMIMTSAKPTSGVRAASKPLMRPGPSGGYFYAPEYVNMVQRQQTWHLPDPVDPKPIERNIGVYFTDLTYAGISFAILEDRKFKTGPEGTIPKMGPTRPDHINDPKYDRKAVDVKGLKLLGDRQLKFLNSWSQDWTGAEQKVVLSQTAFCGAVHIHGSPTNRLLADLDSNAWPQTGRNNALREIRRANATHLCGDQHLAVSVRHGIDTFDDGPFAFTSPRPCQHHLRSLVASCRRQGRAKPSSHFPTSLDRKLSRWPRQQDNDASLREPN